MALSRTDKEILSNLVERELVLVHDQLSAESFAIPLTRTALLSYLQNLDRIAERLTQ